MYHRVQGVGLACVCCCRSSRILATARGLAGAGGHHLHTDVEVSDIVGDATVARWQRVREVEHLTTVLVGDEREEDVQLAEGDDGAACRVGEVRAECCAIANTRERIKPPLQLDPHWFGKVHGEEGGMGVQQNA